MNTVVMSVADYTSACASYTDYCDGSTNPDGTSNTVTVDSSCCQCPPTAANKNCPNMAGDPNGCGAAGGNNGGAMLLSTSAGPQGPCNS